MKQYYVIKVGKEFSGDYHVSNVFPTKELAEAWLTYRGYVWNAKNKYWEVPDDKYVDDGRWWKIQPVTLLEAEAELDYGLDIILEPERM
jgi:hypothetical protein